MASTAHFQNLGTGLQGAVIDAHDPIAINTLSRQEETEQEKVDEKKYGYTSENVDAADSDIMSLKQTEAIVFEMNGDPFPVDPDAPVEGNQLTIRACLVGTLLGFVVGASNVYLGLKTGFTFGATLFAAIVGYGILKTWSVFAPLRFGGGYFGPKENVTVQSAAGAAGGLSGLFVAAVPAMYQLDLLRTPQLDISRLIALSFITAFYGLFFAMPLRKYYVLRQKLTFPSPTATAFTIRSLHSAVTPEARRAAGKKIKILVYSFIFSVVWTVVTKYIPGVLWGWDLGWFFSSWGWHGAIALSNWGWSIQFTPAFTAVGFLTGPNAAFSWLGGAILAYAIIGPILVAKGAAYSPFLDEALGYRNNFSMSTINVKDKVTGVVTTIASRGTARYWLLWPGVLIMLVASFTELFLQAPLFYRLGRQLVNETRKIIGEKRGKDMSHIQEAIPEGSPDPAPPAEQVNTLTWVIGATVSVVLTIVLGKTEFGLNPGLTILSLILGFVFAFIGVNASGTTDVNPIGVIAKAGQLIIGGVTKGTAVPLKDAQLTNLIAGSIVGQSAAHSVDMVGDLKTGHLIGASPSAQFWAQLVGSIAGFAFAPALFLLFTKAYPCIYVPELQGQKCPFSAPSVAAWRAVTIAVTAPELPITPSSGYTAIGLGVLAGVVHTLRHFFPQHRNKLPNMNAVGLAFVVPQVYYAIAMVIGSTIAMLWEWRRPRSWEVWGFALAAGLIAGEGIGGVITAILTIAGVDGGEYGSAVGCIMNEYCG